MHVLVPPAGSRTASSLVGCILAIVGVTLLMSSKVRVDQQS
jgi:hypothetical protein